MSSRFGRNKKRKLIAAHYATTSQLAQLIAKQAWENADLRKQHAQAVRDLDRCNLALRNLSEPPKVFSRTEVTASHYVTYVGIDRLQVKFVGSLDKARIEEFAHQFASKVHEQMLNELMKYHDKREA